jgi:hypothetical protein
VDSLIRMDGCVFCSSGDFVAVRGPYGVCRIRFSLIEDLDALLARIEAEKAEDPRGASGQWTLKAKAARQGFLNREGINAQD